MKDLIKKIANFDSHFWLRIMYLNPFNFEDDLLELMKTNENICSYFDLPVQHFSPKILRRMNRESNGQEYLDLVLKIRKSLPEAVIRSTVIVGFPGEEDEDFKILIESIKEAVFDYLGIFIYSKEDKTPAYDYPDHVDKSLATERYHQLFELQNEIVDQYVKNKFLGKKEMLIEKYDDENNNVFGHIKEQAPEVDGQTTVSLNGKKVADLFQKRLIEVEIDTFNCYDLRGKVL